MSQVAMEGLQAPSHLGRGVGKRQESPPSPGSGRCCSAHTQNPADRHHLPARRLAFL